MNQTLNIQDISITLAIKNYNPTIVTTDFLKGSGVIPIDWEVARSSVVSSRVTRILFKNGIKIEAKIGVITFSETLSNNPTNLQIPNIAHGYVAALPHLEYQGIGINPRRFVTFEKEENGAHKFITETLLAKGEWQNFGTAPMLAGINLVYPIKHCQLRLAINETKLQMSDGELIPSVLFAGNFDYRFTDNLLAERIQKISLILKNYHNYITVYQELIDRQFLASNKEDFIPNRYTINVYDLPLTKLPVID